MKLLTTKQKLWILSKNIKVGESYMFPRYGFTVYQDASYSKGKHLELNPFTKSLDHESFLVKEIKNGFCRGNFSNRPTDNDWWISVDELCQRDIVIVVLLFIVCFLPMVIYNLITK